MMATLCGVCIRTLRNQDDPRTTLNIPKWQKYLLK
jgi:hypothetical protein